MNLLIIHPTPGLEREQPYLSACEILSDKGHNVVFAYNGLRLTSASTVPTEDFNQWVSENYQLIDSTDIATLEAKYPDSNLWLGVVSERRVENYSLLNGSYPTVVYGRDELIYLVKAIVLFYEYVIDKHKIQAVLAHHTDNIHSSLLFEMSRSRSFVSFLLFPDYYWNQSWYYLFDSKYFTSTNIKEYYVKALQEYDTMVLPRESEIVDYLNQRNRKDPSVSSKGVLPRLSLGANIQNSLRVLRRSGIRFFWRKPWIIEGYGHVHIFPSLKGFAIRSVNLLRNRHSRAFKKLLPDVPFVYFPLQRVPEAAMLSRATAYLNQLGLIQSISAALPAGYMLVVKDHPRSIGIHGPDFYRAMDKLPNVVVMEATYPNHQILDECDLVITIAGTLGFQQLMRGKPVVMFGRKFYELLDGVLRINDMNELPYKLKKYLRSEGIPEPEQMRKSLYAFIAAMLEYRYEVDADAKSLHRKPEVLAGLIDRMIEKELNWLVDRSVKEE